MTGPFTTTGKQVEAGARFYMQQHGATVDGRKIEIILRDDAGVADNSKRIAQELLVSDKVNILAGFGLTPIARAVAPFATETKTPMVVMAAATAIVTERSPYIVRSSFPQAAPVVIMADWAAKHGLKKVDTVVSDFAPGTGFGDIPASNVTRRQSCATAVARRSASVGEALFTPFQRIASEAGAADTPAAASGRGWRAQPARCHFHPLPLSIMPSGQ